MEHRADTRRRKGAPSHTRNSRKRRARLRVARPAPPVLLEPGKDYTEEILEFLNQVHGRIRLDGEGDYYYEHVSTISLHFLLQSRLPGKEVLWAWYAHFEGARSESIYQTLPPLRDEEFLDILADCPIAWDQQAVRNSGLVFLPEHRTETYMGLEEFLTMRLEGYESLGDEELTELLTPRDTWTESHLQKLIRQIQGGPLTADQRQVIYDSLESDYLKATARHLMDEALSDAFWKSPPPELDALQTRFMLFARTMTNTARRLGVYLSRRGYEELAQEQGWGARRGPRQGRAASGNGAGRVASRFSEGAYFETLGLPPSATLAEVKSAYREQVKRHHPDQGGSLQHFLQLQEAYEFLLTQVF